MNERLWELLAKYYTNHLSMEEKVELEELLLEYPDNWLKAGLLQQLKWKLKPALPEEKKEIIIERILREKGTGFEKGKKRGHFRYNRKKARAGVLSVLCLITLAGMVLALRYAHLSKANGEWQQVSTANGMKSILHLPDGSEVWLNAGSTLRYNDHFDKEKREVYLEGEAYFMVKHNAARPFIVHAANMNIKVLGTEFDVKAYPDENISETSLIKGSVEVIVSQHGQNQKIYLKPDQKVVINKVQSELPDIKNKGQHRVKPLELIDTVSASVILRSLKKVDNIIPETAWKENMLVFEDEPLSSLAQRLDRWYGVNIMIEDSVLAQQHFTGRADNVSLEKLLKILQMIKPFQYMIQDKEVIIK